MVNEVGSGIISTISYHKNIFIYFLANQRDLENQEEISNDERDAEIVTVPLSPDNPGNSGAWNSDSANSILARLQSNDALNDSEQRKRRNDTLFLGKFLLIELCLDRTNSFRLLNKIIVI